MKQVKAYALKGEMNKAQMLSQQIARYRSIGDRNFATSIMIETKAQVRHFCLFYTEFYRGISSKGVLTAISHKMMYSSHKISRAQVESVKVIPISLRILSCTQSQPIPIWLLTLTGYQICECP